MTVLAAAVGLVFGLDLLWAATGSDTGTVLYGFVDEPAHLLTCFAALLAIAAVRGRALPAAFVAAALAASVAIDLDHVPGYLGWSGLIGTAPRPHTHSLAAVLAVAGFGFAASRRYRPLMLGLAFGISAHLLRDVATGPGVPLLWPLDGATVHVEYGAYALALCGLAAVAIAYGRAGAKLARAGAIAGIGLALLAAGGTGAEGAQGTKPRTVSIGAYVPGADNNPGLIHSIGEELGRSPAIVISYKDFTQAPFVYGQLDDIWGSGAVPMITWEPSLDGGAGASLQAIAAGAYDGYIADAARAAAGWDHPIMLRFAQEANGDWYPWSGHPAAYRAAWRHLHWIFTAEGASNVRWVWTPYVDSGGQMPFDKYYPGDRFVDWAGMDGINWGGSFPWRSCRDVFAASYHELLALTPKPLILAETGSGEGGGSKARWISEMLDRMIPRMQHVRAVVFWSVDDHRGDIRVDSSSSALGALQRGLRNPLYSTSRLALKHVPKRLR